MKKTILLVGLLFSISPLFGQLPPGPIDVTGFNEDVIANGIGPMTNSTTTDVDEVDYCLLSEDWQLTSTSPPITVGLPINGVIPSVAVPGMIYQLQPAATPYDGNNSLRINQSGAANSGSLTLTNPAPYLKLYFLVLSGSGSSDMDVVLHFDDATTETFPNNTVPDWHMSGLPIEAQGFGRGNISNNNVETPANNPKFFLLQVDVSAANQSKNIVSIEFIRNNLAGDIAVFNLFAVSGELAATCFPPINLTASNITSDSAELEWTETGTATLWDIEYGPSGFTPTGTPTNSGVTNPFLLTGLNSQTSYDFYIRADCGAVDGLSIWSGPFSFTTACAVFTAPFTEDFESSSLSINCWSQIQETGDANWTVAEGAIGGSITTAHSGMANMRFVSENDLGSPITKLISPQLDLTTISNPELSFYYGQEDWAGAQNELKIYSRGSSTDTWTEIAHFTDNIDTWAQENISLPNPTATYQIAFEGINNFGYANVLDFIVVQEGLATISPSRSVFEYYPNPVENHLFISGKTPLESFKLYSMSGKKLLSKIFHQKEVKIDLVKFPPGVYFMEVLTNDKKEFIKIIKQ